VLLPVLSQLLAAVKDVLSEELDDRQGSNVSDNEVMTACAYKSRD